MAGVEPLRSAGAQPQHSVYHQLRRQPWSAHQLLECVAECVRRLWFVSGNSAERPCGPKLFDAYPISAGSSLQLQRSYVQFAEAVLALGFRASELHLVA